MCSVINRYTKHIKEGDIADYIKYLEKNGAKIGSISCSKDGFLVIYRSEKELNDWQPN